MLQQISVFSAFRNVGSIHRRRMMNTHPENGEGGISSRRRRSWRCLLDLEPLRRNKEGETRGHRDEDLGVSSTTMWKKERNKNVNVCISFFNFHSTMHYQKVLENGMRIILPWVPRLGVQWTNNNLGYHFDAIDEVWKHPNSESYYSSRSRSQMKIK